MKKKIINVFLTLGLITGFYFSGSMVNAAESDLTANWSVDFDGSKIQSEDYSKQVKEAVASALPGDTIVYSVSYENKSDKTTDWYLSSNVITTLEDAYETTSGGGYGYSISYDLGDGEVPIYSSDLIGGNKDGLRQAAGADGSYFYVGQLAKNEKGKVTLSIKLDGNSHTNVYMNTLGQLSLAFGVNETRTIDNPIINKVVYTLPNNVQIVYVKGPKTGDSLAGLYVCMAALVVGIIFVIAYIYLARRESEGLNDDH